MSKITFGFTAAAAATGPDKSSDADRYAQMITDCRVGEEQGYKTAWLLEHHFTDYFPTPSPLLAAAHISAACPKLSIGTCVIVAPWYNPLRLAEEIAMMSHFCANELHLSFGRGTAKLEYDAYDIDMADGKERYAESMEILNKALSGDAFTHEGKHFKVGREVPLRPTPNRDRIHFYGAVGSVQSAPNNADMGMPVLCNSQFPPYMLEKILAAWRDRADELGLQTNGVLPISANCLVADSDDEARDLARGYMARFFGLQADHYEADANHWKDIAGYEQFSKTFGNLRKLANPDNLDGFLDYQLVGTPATVAERLDALHRIGFNHLIVNIAKEGVPADVRHTTMRRMMTEIAPQFSA